MKQAYKYAILYFLLLSLLLLLSSIMLFDEKIGFSYGEVLEYYRGNEAKFIQEKSISGFLKVLLPHIFAFGLFIMVSLHFLIFTTLKKYRYFKYFIYFTFCVAFLELFSPIFILSGIDFFAFVKLFSFVLLELLLLSIFLLIFLSILRE